MEQVRVIQGLKVWGRRTKEGVLNTCKLCQILLFIGSIQESRFSKNHIPKENVLKTGNYPNPLIYLNYKIFQILYIIFIFIALSIQIIFVYLKLSRHQILWRNSVKISRDSHATKYLEGKIWQDFAVKCSIGIVLILRK